LTALIADLSEVLLDTGPFCRFCEAGELSAFAAYLGPKARITRDVEVELGLRAKEDKHSALKTLHWITPPFPQHEAIALTASQMKQADRIREQFARPGDPMFSHLGEISTVLVAKERGVAVMIDDIDGRRLARARQLPIFGTAGLAVEMVVAEALSDAAGLELFLSTGKSRTKTQYRREVDARR
jgi:hypothetical protein